MTTRRAYLRIKQRGLDVGALVSNLLKISLKIDTEYVEQIGTQQIFNIFC